MAITIPPVSEIPIPPTKADPNNFAARADDFLGALPDFQKELNTTITQMNKLVGGLDQGSPIAAWVAGTTYNFPTVVAGSDGYSYRCVDTAVVNRDPVDDDGTYWRNLSLTRSPIPVGTVVAFIGGYFSDSSNGAFSSVVGNSAATLNSVLNPDGWYVCNGAALDAAESIIFNGVGRYLPNLTDDRFLIGDLTAGAIGGSNSFPISSVSSESAPLPRHNHTGTVSGDGSHSHTTDAHRIIGTSRLGGTATSGAWGVAGSTVSGTGTHSHSVTVNDQGSTSYAHSHTITSLADSNVPKFLSCFYIMKAV